MITQLVAKDVNHKYEIMLLESDYENNDFYIQELNSKNQSLLDALNEFENTLSSLEEGVVYKDSKILYFNQSYIEQNQYLKETRIKWDLFKEALMVIIDNDQIDEEFEQSLNYVNDHNMELLYYCDGIIQSLISYQQTRANFYMLVAIIGFLASFVLLFYTIYKLQKYIIAPLNELYFSIVNLGILNRNKRVSLPTRKDLEPVIEELYSSFSKLQDLIELIENINKGTSFDDILKYIYHSFSSYIPYSHIGIALLKDEDKTIEASYGISDPKVGNEMKEMEGLKVELKGTSLESIIINGSIRVINDLDEYNKNKISKYNLIMKNAGIKSSITMPLRINNQAVGVIFFSSINKNIYTHDHISFLETLSNSIAISFNKNIFIDELIYSSILALAKMAESRDQITGDHLDRMKHYAVKITEYLLQDKVYEEQINIGFVKEIEKFSPLHDIGKVGIRDTILLKPGKLLASEFDEMKKHTVLGAEVLRTAENNINKHNNNLFKVGIEIAESHHEKWDGTGYPYCKKAEEIPLSARIVAIADVLDALTSKRPYKEPFSFQQSFDIIVEGKGKHFDPQIIECIIKHEHDLYEDYLSFKSTLERE